MTDWDRLERDFEKVCSKIHGKVEEKYGNLTCSVDGRAITLTKFGEGVVETEKALGSVSNVKRIFDGGENTMVLDSEHGRVIMKGWELD